MSYDSVDPRPLADLHQRLVAGGGLLSVDCVLKVVIVVVAYFVTGWLGLLVAIPPGYATAVWPASGIALAGILWWRARVWPGIWLGSFLVNVWVSFTATNAEINSTSLAVAANIAVGSTLQALLGAFLLQRWVGVGRLFERGSTILAFVAIEALSCLLAPTLGVTSLCFAGIVDWTAYLDSWRTWWLGDLIGVLVVTPVLITSRHLLNIDRRPWKLAEAGASMVVFAALTGGVFVGASSLARAQYPLAFVPLPCLVWMAFRFAPGGVALATLLLSGIAVSATSLGSGPFVRDITNDSLLMLQAFTGLTTLTGLTLAAAVTGHKQAEAQLRQLNAELEQRVRQRTTELAESNRQLAIKIIEHQRAEEKAQQLALTDELTGLHNRRGFFLLAEQERQIALRMRGKCLLIFVDLDGLKKVNDAQGHQAGDAMIVDAARVLAKTFRKSDVVARMGGDEFAIFALVSTDDASNTVTERLRTKIEECNRQSGRCYTLAMSVGIQELSSTIDTSLEILVAQADQAMYAHKRENKQRTGAPPNQTLHLTGGA